MDSPVLLSRGIMERPDPDTTKPQVLYLRLRIADVGMSTMTSSRDDLLSA